MRRARRVERPIPEVPPTKTKTGVGGRREERPVRVGWTSVLRAEEGIVSMFGGGGGGGGGGGVGGVVGFLMLEPDLARARKGIAVP